MQSKMANPERCCAMCHHCLKGIPFDKKYFLCFACDELAICTSCHKRHPKSHLPWMKVATDKATLRDAAMETHRKCMHCGTTAHARIDCNACEGTACFDCYADNRELWGDHTHKAYTYTRAPDDFNAPSFDRDCLSCTLGASMGHCSHCLEGEQRPLSHMLFNCTGFLEPGTTHKYCTISSTIIDMYLTIKRNYGG